MQKHEKFKPVNSWGTALEILPVQNRGGKSWFLLQGNVPKLGGDISCRKYSNIAPLLGTGHVQISSSPRDCAWDRIFIFPLSFSLLSFSHFLSLPLSVSFPLSFFLSLSHALFLPLIRPLSLSLLVPCLFFQNPHRLTNILLFSLFLSKILLRTRPNRRAKPPLTLPMELGKLCDFVNSFFPPYLQYLWVLFPGTGSNNSVAGRVPSFSWVNLWIVLQAFAHKNAMLILWCLEKTYSRCFSLGLLCFVYNFHKSVSYSKGVQDKMITSLPLKDTKWVYTKSIINLFHKKHKKLPT